jgi:hypothetical protein
MIQEVKSVLGIEREQLVEEDTQPSTFHAIHLNSLVYEFEKRWRLNRSVDEGVTEKSEDGAEEAVAVVVVQPSGPQKAH